MSYHSALLPQLDHTQKPVRITGLQTVPIDTILLICTLYVQMCTSAYLLYILETSPGTIPLFSFVFLSPPLSTVDLKTLELAYNVPHGDGQIPYRSTDATLQNTSKASVTTPLRSRSIMGSPLIFSQRLYLGC